MKSSKPNFSIKTILSLLKIALIGYFLSFICLNVPWFPATENNFPAGVKDVGSFSSFWS